MSDDELFDAIAAAETTPTMLLINYHNTVMERINEFLGVPKTAGMVATTEEWAELNRGIDLIT